MSEAYPKDTKVEWRWGNGTATGHIREVYTDKITKTIKETDVTRNASDDDPAYLIEQDDGDQVLKLHSELNSKA